LKKGIEKNDWIPWLALKAVPGVGNRVFLKLLRHFGSPESVLQASKSQISEVSGITDRLASDIVGFRIPHTIQEDLENVNKNGCTLVTYADETYPALLREIHDPPPFLYVYGTLRHASKNVSIVGSRDATTYGQDVTRRLSADLASSGITVVSGLARGIDSTAHLGALSAGGETIAVLGCGLGTVYPSENKELFHRIARQGAVVSEFPFVATPEPHHFPIRNRIISGMSFGTVIVEATRRSGSLITAQLAVEQGREVFAVPGSVTSFRSTGTHGLIKQGAKLVEHVQDILDELPFETSQPRSYGDVLQVPKKAQVSPVEKRVLDELGGSPVHIDCLIQQLAMTPADVSSLLLHLELKGLVTQSPGKRFAKAVSA
jgi:DNA processing protein